MISKSTSWTLAVLAVMATGCSSTIHKVASVDGIETLSIDAKQRLVLVNEYGGVNNNTRIACAEPSPDAIVAQAAALSGKVSVQNQGSGGLGAASNEVAGSIGLRTQTIQVLRDGYYRLCEAYMNGAINRKEYSDVLNHVDGVIAVVMAIDVLGGPLAAPAVVLNAGGGSADTQGGAAAGKAAGVNIENFLPERGTLSDAQAKAIENIIKMYLTHKARRGADG